MRQIKLLIYVFIIFYIIISFLFLLDILEEAFIKERVKEKPTEGFSEKFCPTKEENCLTIFFGLAANPKTDKENIYLFGSEFVWYLYLENVGKGEINQTFTIRAIPKTILSPYHEGKDIEVELGKDQEMEVVSYSEFKQIYTFDDIGVGKIIITPSNEKTHFLNYKEGIEYHGNYIYFFEIISSQDYMSSKRMENRTNILTSLTGILILLAGIQIAIMLKRGKDFY